MNEQVVEVHWFGLSLCEPMTFFTDVLITAFCVYFWAGIKQNNPRNAYWELFFLIMGLSTLLAGIAHMFVNYFGMNLHFISRAISGISIYAAQLATVQRVKNEKTKKVFLG